LRSLSLTEYIDFYNKYKRLPNNQYSNRDKVLNEKQLNSKYEVYLKSLEKQETKTKKNLKLKNDVKTKSYIDEQWEECKKLVHNRDGNCRLLSILYSHEINDELRSILQCKEYTQLDVAHIFGKGSYSHMKYDVDNMILLSRVFHSRIDSYQDPLTGRAITKEQRDDWWKFILSPEFYDELENRSRNKDFYLQK
jgi:hypothetical protein